MKPFMRMEFINEFGDSTKIEFDSSTYDQTEAGWIVQNFRQFMLAIGFHPDTVKEYLPEGD